MIVYCMCTCLDMNIKTIYNFKKAIMSLKDDKFQKNASANWVQINIFLSLIAWMEIIWMKLGLNEESFEWI